jgi:hypothetical protein
MAQIGETLLADTEQLIQPLVHKILDQEPAYQAGRTISIEDLTDTVRANAVEIYSAIAGKPLEISDFEDTGRRRAASSIPLHAVLHAYRIGGLYHWENFARVALALPGGDAVIADGASVMWQIIEIASQRVTTGYRETVEARRLQSHNERTALVDMLLTGSFAADSDVWDAAEALHLPVSGDFVVVAASTPRPGAAVLPDAERLFETLHSPSVWRTEPSAQVGLVSINAPATLDRVVELLDAAATGPIGVSGVFTALDHAPEALRQARVASAALRGKPAGATKFCDVPLQALVVQSATPADDLCRLVLGDLLALPEAESRPLLDTLRTWTEAGGSTSACAAAMFVHRNSVSRRLQRIHELTGRDPQTPIGMAELFVALEAHRLTPGG